MSYVRAFPEAVHERKMGELIASFLVSHDNQKMREDDVPASPSVQLIVLLWPFDDLWFCRAHEQWQRDVYFEVRRIVSPCDMGILAG